MLCRRIEGSKLVSKRFLSKTNRGPKWIEVVSELNAMSQFHRRVVPTHTHTYTTPRIIYDINRCIYIAHSLPPLSPKFTGDKPTLIIEDSIVDPAARTFTTYTKNITSTKLLSVEEKCVYYVSPDNQNE